MCIIYKLGEAIISRNERERISRKVQRELLKVIGNNCDQLLPETND